MGKNGTPSETPELSMDAWEKRAVAMAYGGKLTGVSMSLP